MWVKMGSEGGKQYQTLVRVMRLVSSAQAMLPRSEAFPRVWAHAVWALDLFLAAHAWS